LQAIPSNKRPNAPGEEQEDPEAQAQEDPQEDPQEGIEGTRKSTRARKRKYN